MLLKAVILCFLPWLWQQKASCQASLICGIIEKKAPDNPVFSDRFGNLYSAEELSLIGLNIQQNNCGPIEDFDLIFEGAIPFSQQEIQTICEVFTDLSAIINAP
ncbi:MAG TPA: hypothetical protein VK168_06785 [Saprospiraceae bacterium]|nr:hypothetical protein [Saprospiraceae bacterium]